MESGDASNEEAPPCDPKRKDLMQEEQSKAISMLVAMETEDGLRKGAIMVITQKNWLGMCRAKSIHELGVINSTEFFVWKKNLWKKGYVLPLVSLLFYFSEVWWEVTT